MVPVNLLSSHDVNALIMGGNVMRPLVGFRQVGIDVYHDDKQPLSKPVVKDFIACKLLMIQDNQVYGGGGGQM